MRYVLPLLVIGLVGCYSPRSVGSGPDGYAHGLYGAASYQPPLQASLWIDPYTGFASFDVSRDAHVALFVWTPGGHFEMLYPAIGYGTRQEFTGGRHHLRTLRTLAHGRSRASQLPAQFAATGAMRGPTYFTLIASAEPLDVQSFYSRAGWVHRAFWSHNPYTATELLASQIVPRPATTEWTAAYQVVWFEDRWQPRANFRWVQCPDGTILAVPIEALLAGIVQCPNGETADPAPGDDVVDGDVARRVAQRRAERALTNAGRASDRDVAELIRQIRETRGRAALEDDEQPVPSWRRAAPGERSERLASVPVPLHERPDIGRAPESEAGRSPSGERPAAWGDRDRARAGAPPPRASRSPARAERTRPQADPARPAAQPTRPAAERPRPQAERPQPRANSPRSEGARPQPERPSPPSRAAPESPPDGDAG